MTIIDLFSIPIYKTNLLDQIDVNLIEKSLQVEFSKSSNKESLLETNGGISTYTTNCKLHLENFSQKLSSLVLDHCRFYWKILDIDQRLEPKIDQCWANVHKDRSMTLEHSHSLYPIVATFYVKAEPNAGNLVLKNPMEYGLTHIPYSVPIEQKIESNIKIKTGDLILFPGWIRHKTQENYSYTDRIVMSFNIIYNGKYLSSETNYYDLNKEVHTSEVERLQNKILNLEFIVTELTRSISNEQKT